MLPTITELEFEIEDVIEDLPPIGKSFLYDFDKNDFVLKDGKLIELHGLDSLKMWIKKTLKTERFRFKIYEDAEYGVTIEDLLGSNYPKAFVESEIEREVTTSLIQHNYITEIREWTFEKKGSRMIVKFTVVSPLGTYEEELIFNV